MVTSITSNLQSSQSRKTSLLKLIAFGIFAAIAIELITLVITVAFAPSQAFYATVHLFLVLTIFLPALFCLQLSQKAMADLILDLQRERERLRSTFSAVAEGIVVHNTSGEIIECNPAAERILGLSSDQLKGRQAIDPRWRATLEDGNSFPGAQHPASITLRTGKAVRNIVMGIETPDSENRWLSVSTEPIRNASGQLDSVVASFADITLQRDQAMRLELIIESAGLGTWEWDIVSGQVIYSDNWAKMLGYDVDEIDSDVSSWEKLLNPDDLYRVLHSIQEHFQGNTEEYRCELNMRHKDGSWKWILASGKVTQRDFDGKPIRMVGVHVDIHAMKSLQAELRNLSERYAFAIAGTSDGTWDWRLGTDEVWYSTRFWTLLGFPSGGPFPPNKLNSFLDRLHPDHTEMVQAAIQEHLDNGVPYDVEYQLELVSGDYGWFRARGGAQKDETGTAVRMAGTLQDISQIKTSERKLQDAQLRAQAASDAKSEFLANMSHEIRTPMTAILGFADLLASESEGAASKPSEHKEYVHTIQRNGKQLLKIINDILDISKIEAGKMTVELISTSPRTLVEEVLQLMTVNADAKKLSLNAIFETALPATVMTDPVRLRQILINLVGNAVKFTEVGGVTLFVRFDASVAELQFRIVDTGIGMTTEQAKRLFEPFSQADSSMTRRFGGTGLGLNISKRFAELLGGSIRAESMPGKGSVFVLSLNSIQFYGMEITPHGLDPQVSISVPQSTSALPLEGLRILFAEDGPDNQLLIAHILRRAGAVVTVVENGRLAVEALTEDHTLSGKLASPPPFDLLLSDMQMPELDGYSTAKLLREKGWEFPIIALTAHAMSSDMAECLAAGCNDYATKPIVKADLIATCAKWMRKPGQEVFQDTLQKLQCLVGELAAKSNPNPNSGEPTNLTLS
jgi:PAS domain S-box-containing protein